MGRARIEPVYCGSLRRHILNEVYFYHLTRQTADQALVPLLGKCLSQKWRVQVQATDQSYLDWLDEKLWLGADDGFLPHGLDTAEHADLQPILLTIKPDTTGFDCQICLNGAGPVQEQMADLKRVCILFNGNDPDELALARQQWSELVQAGVGAKYWSEESGSWDLKAQKNIAVD